MLERTQIENILRMNGVAVNAPDEEIKSILLRAQWHEKDVETAMLILRENMHSHKTHVDSMYKIFKSDEKLRPETITALLGIDTLVSHETLNAQQRKLRSGMSYREIVYIVLLSLFFAGIFAVCSLWYMQVSMFS